MTVEIIRRERLSNGWYRYKGAVNGETRVGSQEVGVRLPVAYIDAVSESDADAEVKEALCSEYERLHRAGGAYVR